jgi:hypothetical protein
MVEMRFHQIAFVSGGMRIISEALQFHFRTFENCEISRS